MENIEKDIRKVLELLYEAEALAELAVRRAGTAAFVPMSRLLGEKCRMLGEMSVSLGTSVHGTEEAAAPDNLYDSLTYSGSDMEDDVALAQSEMEEIAAMASSDPEDAPYADGRDSRENPEHMTSEPGPAKSGDRTPAAPAPQEVEFVEEDDFEGTPDSDMGDTNVNRPPLLSFFTVNDRFRFRRSLFGGSDRKFLESLAVMESADNYRQASDYMADDLRWDRENPEVKLFAGIMEKYFTTTKKG